MYKVYIVECADSTLYTWITTDLERRIKQHNWEISWWARYTSSRRPVKIVYYEEFRTRGEASKREYEIKKLKRHEKFNLINC